MFESVTRERRGYVGLGPMRRRPYRNRIERDVCECLIEDPDIDASHIEVMVEDLTVLLRGRVESPHMLNLAEECALRVPGVTNVVSELEVVVEPSGTPVAQTGELVTDQ